MLRHAHRLSLPCFLAVALLVAGSSAVRAQVYDSQDLGHAGLYQPETIENANKLIERMKEDTGKTLIIETFARPAWGHMSKALEDESKKKKSKDEADFVDHANQEQRKAYFEGWARDRAVERRTDGVYVLISKKPKQVVIVVEPESNDKLFPAPKRAWLHKEFTHLVSLKDNDLLNEVIPGVWYTVQDLQRNPSQDGYGWTWMPVLTIIGSMLGAWAVIALLRGFVGIVRSIYPEKPEPAKTNIPAQTTVSMPPPGPPNGPRKEDSVDY